MTLAGLDLGTSRAKAVWGDPQRARSTSIDATAELLEALRADGVTRVAVAGASHVKRASPCSSSHSFAIRGSRPDHRLKV